MQDKDIEREGGKGREREGEREEEDEYGNTIDLTTHAFEFCQRLQLNPELVAGATWPR